MIQSKKEPLKLLELFAGSRSVGKVAEELGIEVFSVDVKPFDGIDLVIDIENLSPKMIPFQPDIIWASPPCTTYSMAGISHHRKGKDEPISDFAKKSDRLVINTLRICRESGAIYYIENPRAMLRKMDFMADLERACVSYCQYGDDRMKPTDIWTNNLFSVFNVDGWIPRRMCFNGNRNCHHEAAPRGSKTGTQGRKNNYERSKIPRELAEDCLLAAIMKLKS